MSTIPKQRRARLVARAAVVIVVACLVGGAAYAQTATTATATDTVIRAAANTVISPTGGLMKTAILSATLPAGNYVLSGSGTLVNFGPSDYTRCQIVVDDVEVSNVSTIVGNQSTGAQGAAGSLSPFSLSGAAKVGSLGATATLQCWHDTINGATPRVEAGATLVVHRTPSLQIVSQ